MALKVGSVTSGKVESVMPFGAFVALPDNKSGLVHISEITNEYVENINDYIKTGDTVSVKVLDIDKAGRISLSMKKAKQQEDCRGACTPMYSPHMRITEKRKNSVRSVST